MSMQQMEMFNIGGLKDEGGSKDSVSGNVVPSGSLKEEVRDDIDAKLSPGEFVFPADVVRYIGLEKLMLMRDKAKKGLKRMEAMGQMGNSEEATLDDDVPFEQSDLLIVAGSPMEEQMNTLNRGGMPIRASNGTAVPNAGTTAPGSGLGAGRGDQLLGSNLQQYFNPETNEIRSVLVSRDNLTGELKPVSPLPEGFIRDTPENRNEAMRPTDPSARVETARVPTQRDRDIAMQGASMPGGPSRDDISVSQMTMTEKNDLADYYDANPIAASLALNMGNIATMSTTQVNPMVAGVQEIFGVRDTVVGQGTLDQKSLKAAQATFKAMTDEERKAQREKDMQKAVDRVQTDYMDAIGASQEMRDDAVGVMGTIGGIPSALSVDMVTGVVTDPMTGDIIGGRDADNARKAAGFGKSKKSDDPTAPDVSGGGIGAGSAPGRGAGTQTPSGAGAAGEFGGDPGRGSTGTMGGGLGGPAGGPQSAGEVGGNQPEPMSDMPGDQYVSGGLIPKPKRKKQKKKMKRGGLASRK